MKTLVTELAVFAPGHGPAYGCGGSRYYWHFDTEYPCGGCHACVPEGKAAYFVGLFIYRAAHFAAVSASASAYGALAAVGKAVAAAAAPGAGVGAFVTGAIAVWNEHTKGAWYEVTGKRGTAKAHFGKVGECVWVGERGFTKYGHTSYSVRVGIKPLGASEALFVPASCVTRVLPPAEALPAIAAKEAAVAEKAARTPLAAGKGSIVTVAFGPCAGAIGRVFWVGSGKGGPRFGLDPDLDRKKGRCPSPLWVDARDCVAYVPPVSAAKVAFPPKTVAEAAAPVPAPVTAKKMPKVVFEKAKEITL